MTESSIEPSSLAFTIRILGVTSDIVLELTTYYNRAIKKDSDIYQSVTTNTIKYSEIVTHHCTIFSLNELKIARKI